MSARSGIAKAISAKIASDMDGANPNYINNVFDQVTNKVVQFSDITAFPTITVTPGPETIDELPSNFGWRYLTLYIRIYVEDAEDAQGALETLITDIDSFIDLNNQIGYTETTASGTETRYVTEMTITNITTDEGILDPQALGEVVVSVRYEKHRKI